MSEEKVKQTCPRRMEDFGPWQREEGLDSWFERDGQPCCDFCGSMSSEAFLKAIEAGVELIPTDKNYKVYVRVPDPRAGQVIEVGRESGGAIGRDGKPTKDDLTPEELAAGRYDRPIMGTASATTQLKFYFQHLSTEQKHEFIRLFNAGKLKLGYPGRFYVLPYVIKMVNKQTDATS